MKGKVKHIDLYGKVRITSVSYEAPTLPRRFITMLRKDSTPTDQLGLCDIRHHVKQPLLNKQIAIIPWNPE